MVSTLNLGYPIVDLVSTIPRQLAPSVGILRAGITVSTAPTLAVDDSPAPWRAIRFGALTFTAHLPALRPAFDALRKGLDLTFGDLHFHVNQSGMIQLPELTRLDDTESTPYAEGGTRHFVGLVSSGSILPALDYNSPN
jgi:hypothetical protein